VVWFADYPHDGSFGGHLLRRGCARRACFSFRVGPHLVQVGRNGRVHDRGSKCKITGVLWRSDGGKGFPNYMGSEGGCRSPSRANSDTSPVLFVMKYSIIWMTPETASSPAHRALNDDPTTAVARNRGNHVLWRKHHENTLAAPRRGPAILAPEYRQWMPARTTPPGEYPFTSPPPLDVSSMGIAIPTSRSFLHF